jgi:hypothetical protein
MGVHYYFSQSDNTGKSFQTISLVYSCTRVRLRHCGAGATYGSENLPQSRDEKCIVLRIVPLTVPAQLTWEHLPHWYPWIFSATRLISVWITCVGQELWEGEHHAPQHYQRNPNMVRHSILGASNSVHMYFPRHWITRPQPAGQGLGACPTQWSTW